MTNEEFTNTFFPKSDNDNDNLQPKPDCEMMYKELKKTGVTRKLLWEEYSSEVKVSGKIPLQYSQFCNYFNHYLEVNKATMHFEHKISERTVVDWLCKDSHNYFLCIRLEWTYYEHSYS